MEAITRLNELLSKAAKITNAQAKEAAMHLLSFYSETGENTRVADYLMKFKTTVCLYFFEEAIKVLDPETEIQSIHSAICSTETYKNNKNHVATARGFIIAAVLIKNEINIARTVLMRTITDVEKHGKFSKAVATNFKKNVLDYCGSFEPIKELGGKPWNNTESKELFLRFIEAVNGNAIPNRLPETVVTDDSQNKVIGDLMSVAKEVTELLPILSETNGAIALLRKEIASRDSRITELESELDEKNRMTVSLQRKLEESQQLVQNGEVRIADLTDRLKTSLQMDNIYQNQELTTLKANIQNSLKIEYSDYLIIKDKKCNPDTYGALISSMTRIFKTLRRNGITID